MILVVNSYDSFAYNLVQYVGSFDTVTVRRNDEIDLEGIRTLDPDGIVVSPGPGTPRESGVSVDVFAETEYPALGVCLGHQALCAARGIPVRRAPGGRPRETVRGRPRRNRNIRGSPRSLRGRTVPLAGGRSRCPPDGLLETAHTDERGIVMGVRHAERSHVGVQFHPESVLTDAGRRIAENFCSTIAHG